MRYYPFSRYLREKYGVRIHRLGLNPGFTCPNRDGTLGTDGCIFCNDEGFSRFANMDISLEEQIDISMDFASGRYNAKKFIAYFQTGTGTHNTLTGLKNAYDVIRKYPDIVGLFISTRPDCVDKDRLDLIESYSDDYEVWIEYGIQTVHDDTLTRIGRKHTFSQSRDAILETSGRNIKTGVHLILGLPGENEKHMIDTARTISGLPVSGIKFHALHVLKDTKLEGMYGEGKINLMDFHEYVNIICNILEYIPKDCIILRLVSDAQNGLLVAPGWMKDKQKIINAVEKKLEEHNTFQGALHEIPSSAGGDRIKREG